MKKFSILLSLIVMLVLTGCGQNNTSKAEFISYDEKIINESAEFVNSYWSEAFATNPFANNGRTFEVGKSAKDQSMYIVNNNGSVFTVQLVDNPDSEYVPTDISDIKSSKTQKIVNSSKQKISNYIDESTILQDKENLKNCISDLEVKFATFLNSKNKKTDEKVGAYFSYKDNVVYIEESCKTEVSEWMICHEMVHALCFYTHKSNIENEEYPYQLFNEILTDIITSSLNPDIQKDSISGYMPYYYLVYPYIDLFGISSIKAYFYGYDVIFDSVETDEFNMFVWTIENYNSAETAVAFYNNLVLKWNAIL